MVCNRAVFTKVFDNTRCIERIRLITRIYNPADNSENSWCLSLIITSPNESTWRLDVSMWGVRILKHILLLNCSCKWDSLTPNAPVPRGTRSLWTRIMYSQIVKYSSRLFVLPSWPGFVCLTVLLFTVEMQIYYDLDCKIWNVNKFRIKNQQVVLIRVSS